MLGQLVAEPLLTFQTPDGRQLAYARWGDPDGFPILVLHGTPGCRLERWPDEDVYRRLGVLLITHDRAGYGQSTRRPGRRVVDEVDDVAALADELGLEHFGVTGGSGGGAHALACAARLPDRIERVSCVVGVAPFGDAGLDREAWLAGMDPENIKEFGWAEAGEDVLTRELEAEYAKIAASVADDPSSVLGDFDLSESDRKELAREERAQIIRESWAEHSARGVGGWVDDDLAHLHPWGFDVAEITIPVLVRYGATDVLVPPAHGDWLAANVPGCVVKVDGGAGHLGADPKEEIAETARWLRDGVPPPGSSWPPASQTTSIGRSRAGSGREPASTSTASRAEAKGATTHRRERRAAHVATFRGSRRRRGARPATRGTSRDAPAVPRAEAAARAPPRGAGSRRRRSAAGARARRRARRPGSPPRRRRAAIRRPAAIAPAAAILRARRTCRPPNAGRLRPSGRNGRPSQARRCAGSGERARGGPRPGRSSESGRSR